MYRMAAASTVYAQLVESILAPVKSGSWMVDDHVTCAWFLVAPDGLSWYRANRRIKICGGCLRACTAACECHSCVRCWTRSLSPGGKSTVMASAHSWASTVTTPLSSSSLRTIQTRANT